MKRVQAERKSGQPEELEIVEVERINMQIKNKEWDENHEGYWRL